MIDHDDSDVRVLEAIDRAIAAAVASDLDCLHVVHVYDRLLGLASAHGPFHDGPSAAAFADRLVFDVEGDEHGTLRVDVLVLEPVLAP